MGIAHSQRIQRQIISRRRTQYLIERNGTEVLRTTSGLPSYDQTGEEEFSWTIVGYGDEERLDETD
jgi:hypothetical protein